jgi:hypothetical protein
MINLQLHAEPLQTFLREGLARVSRDHPATSFGHVCLYSCPWASWVSLCLHPTPQLEQNCPDFSLAEAAIYDAPDWQIAYESAPPLHVTSTDGSSLLLNVEADGDEALNAVIFAFLKHAWDDPRAQAALRLVAGRSVRYGVQMLDSRYNESWTLLRP